ncbi:MAG: glycosyltransferase family 2 protein [Acidimicrobiales bacterium]
MAAGIALLWGVVYLCWRASFTWHGAQLGLFGVLFASEVVGWLTLASFAFLAWKIPRSERPAIGWRPTVDVFVCTYDEAPEILTATLIGCDRLRYPHRTWVLDDGRRPEMRDLAARFGAGYMERATNEHAKAGNINHALGGTTGQVILILDADHVPQPDLLDATIGYFDDPSVALVQTPHDFSNRDSFQHFDVDRHAQSMFFEVILPGKERHNGVFWCGSAALVLRRALEDIGGIATETIAEDFHTSIRLHKAGWRTRYHHETLVQGLAPHDLDSFLLQRDRWARGNLTVLRTPESPIIASGLSLKQRASYLSSLLGYFLPYQRLAQIAVLVTMLTTGMVPFRATPWQLVILWGTWMLLEARASSLLCRRETTLWDGSYSSLLTMGIYSRAVLGLLRPIGRSFSVTPKDGVDTGGWRAVARLRLVLVIGSAVAAAMTLRLLTMVGLIWLPPLGTFPSLVGLALAGWELALITLALVRVAHRHQIRHHYRVPVALAATLNDAIVRLVDLTPTGAGIIGPVPMEPGSQTGLHLDLPLSGGKVRSMRLRFTVASCQEVSGRSWRMGGSLDVTSEADREALIDHCQLVGARWRLIGSGHLVDVPIVADRVNRHLRRSHGTEAVAGR